MPVRPTAPLRDLRGRGARSRPPLARSRRCSPGGRPRSGTRATSSIRSSSTRPIGCARGRSRSGTLSPEPGSPGSPTGSRASSIRRRSCFCSTPRPWRARSSSCSTLRSRPGARGAFSRRRTCPTRARSSARRRFAASGFAASLSVYWNHFGAWAYLPGDRGAGAFGVPVPRGDARIRGPRRPAGHGGQPGDLGGHGRARRRASPGARARSFPSPSRRSRASARLRRFAAGVGLGLALAAWVIVPDGGARRALRAPPRVLRRRARRGRGRAGAMPARCPASRPLPSAGRISRRSSCRPSCWSPRPRRFSEDHRRRLALLLAVFAALGILLAAAGPPGAWLRGLPPLDRVRYPAKWLAWSSFGVADARGARLRRPALLSRRARAAARSSARPSVAALGAAALSPLPPPVRLCCCVGAAALGFLALGLGRRPARGRASRRGGGRGPRRRARPGARGRCRASRPRRR